MKNFHFHYKYLLLTLKVQSLRVYQTSALTHGPRALIDRSDLTFG